VVARKILIPGDGMDAILTEPVLVLGTDGVKDVAQAVLDRGVPLPTEPAEQRFQPSHTTEDFQGS
jgi:hypothetical protein